MVSLMEGEGERRELEDRDFERELELDGVAALARRGGVMDVIRVRGRDSSSWADPGET